MNDIFGIPMNGIMVALAAILLVALLGVAWVAARRPVIFKMGMRNIPRRRAQTTLIVTGLMLSTLIMAAALIVGDSISASMTTEVYDSVGQVDEVVIASPSVETWADLVALERLDASALPVVEQALAGAPVDGVMPLLEARVAVLHDSAGLAEPDVVLVGLDPERLPAFGGLAATDGATIDFANLGSGSVVVSERLAGDLDISAGDTVSVFIDGARHDLAVAAVARDSYLSGTRRDPADFMEVSGIAMPLAELQERMGQPGAVTAIAISNEGNAREGYDGTGAVLEALRPSLESQGLGVYTIKEHRVDGSERIATAFTSIFVLLGLFSVMSGVLLIVLIFTMLASERRSEMGMARAVGAHRSQLIQQFVSEGAGYALVAGLAGLGLGVLAAWGMVQGMGIIFGAYVSTLVTEITPRSLVVAYCLGTVITFLTIVAASWKISRLNIVAAIRDIPDAVSPKRKRSTLVWALVLMASGGLLAMVGSGGASAPAFSMGMSLAPFGVALLLRFFGAPGRPVFTALGVYLLVFWLLPESTFSDLFGEFSFGLEMFFLSGIFMVVGATIVVLQNTDVLLAGVSRIGGLFPRALPAVRAAVAYPSAARGRTGKTVAMFSLIVFSIVMFATMNQNYVHGMLGDEASGGWDVKASIVATNPPADLVAALRAQGMDISNIRAVGTAVNPSQSFSEIRLSGAEEWKLWPVFGVDQQMLDHTRLTFSQRASGYDSDADVLRALATQPGVAVIDSTAIPVEGNIGEDAELFSLEGLKASDKSFAPVQVELVNPLDGQAHNVTVIGVIDGSLGVLNGLYASRETTDAIYDGYARTTWYVDLADAGSAGRIAGEIQAAMLSSAVQASDIRDDLEEAQRQENGFLYIIQGFMGLGLVVGVAAVGVIAFRSVVERRQQIGVLRALGFEREMIALSFMIETLFVVGLGVLTGAALGLRLAQKLVADPDQGFAADAGFVIPWGFIIPVALATVVVALLMTWLPARQAGRIAPAEALRYE